MEKNKMINMYKYGNFKSRYRTAGMKMSPMHYYMQEGGLRGVNQIPLSPPPIGTDTRTLIEQNSAKIKALAEAKKNQRLMQEKLMEERRMQMRSAATPRGMQTGGMYEDNTATALGQGAGPQSTANIVYQESDPNLQQQREQNLEDVIKRENVRGAETVAEAERLAEQGEIMGEQKAFEEAAKFQQQTGQAEQAAAAVGELAGFSGQAQKAGAIKAAANAYRLQRAANIAAKGKDIAKAAELAQKGAGALSKTGNIVKGTGEVVQAAGKGSALLSGAKAFLSSGAGLGLAASGLGYGVKKLFGDEDPTTATTGDIAGSALSAAGTGMAIGSVIPGIGTAIGGIVGGLYGAGKSIFGARKARKAKEKAEREAKEKQRKAINKFNKESMENFATNLAIERAGATKQKMYSGYDLGQNVVARMGGMKMGMPRYGMAA